jgi:hypothetical protein
MSASGQFPQYRPDLSLKRKGYTRPPMEYMSSESMAGEEIDPYSKAALQMAWEKLYRARSILEAEQAHLRDDRMVLRAEFEALAAREQAVAQREEQIRRQQMEIALDRAEAEEAKMDQSALARLTKAPFDIARSVFGTKK